jgi:hypothetical protein
MKTFTEWLDLREMNDPDQPTLAYDKMWNAAFCPECARMALAGEMPPELADDPYVVKPGEVVPISLNQLRDLWANEQMPRCMWCDRPLWKPMPRPSVN